MDGQEGSLDLTSRLSSLLLELCEVEVFLLSSGLPPEILDLPHFMKKIYKNVPFYRIQGKHFHLYPFLKDPV